jgi:hypothetical protein
LIMHGTNIKLIKYFLKQVLFFRSHTKSYEITAVCIVLQSNKF